MTTINFRKVHVENVAGEIVEIDLSQALGSFIYDHAHDITDSDLGKKLYRDGEIELSDADAERIRYLLISAPDLVFKIKQAIKEVFKNNGF